MSLSDFTLIILVNLLSSSIVGIVSSKNTLNLFLREISLSSTLPLVELLLNIRFVQTSSGQSKNRTPFTSALSPNTSLKPSRFSWLRGKPSTIYMLFYINLEYYRTAGLIYSGFKKVAGYSDWDYFPFFD